MRAQVHRGVVRVHTPDGGLLEFKRQGDLSVAANPKILKPTLGKYYTKARKAALEELSQELWGAR